MPRVAQNFSEEKRRRAPSNTVVEFHARRSHHARAVQLAAAGGVVNGAQRQGHGRRRPAISDRGRRVLVYASALLLAPLPVMPFAKGTDEFAWGVGACGAALAAASYYVARGEWRLRRRGLLGNKLLAASLITLAFGLALAAGSFVYLSGV